MKYYIFCNKIAHLKLQGEYAGEIGADLKSFNANFPLFIEILPQSQNYLTIAKEINSTTLCHSDLQVFRLSDGLLIMPILQKNWQYPFKILHQNSSNGVSVYAFSDGGLKLFICNENLSQIINLPFYPTNIKSEFFGELVFIYAVKDYKNHLYVFSRNNLQNAILNKPNCNYSLTTNLAIITQKTNSLSGVTFEYKISPKGEIISKTFTKSAPISRLNQRLLPFALLQDCLLQVDFSEYLHPDLKEYKNIIKEYLGDFYCFLPFCKDDLTKAIIIGKNAKEITFSFKNGLIQDIY